MIERVRPSTRYYSDIESLRSTFPRIDEVSGAIQRELAQNLKVGYQVPTDPNLFLLTTHSVFPTPAFKVLYRLDPTVPRVILLRIEPGAYRFPFED